MQKNNKKTYLGPTVLLFDIFWYYYYPTYMLTAYSRDPNMLFSSDQTTSLKKTSQYKNVFLKIDLSADLPAQTHIFEAVVDWYNTTIKIFLDSDDALNNIIYFEGPFHIPCIPQLAEVYVSETFQFLARGHSLHHPSCTCLNINLFTIHRAIELGIIDGGCDHGGCCPLQTNGLGKSIEDIALELGVSPDFSLDVQVSSRIKMPLFKVLTKLGSLDFAPPNILSSPLCCIPLEIHSAKDILDAAKAMYPRPFLLDYGNHASSYFCETKSLLEDLEWLKTRLLVRVVASQHPSTYSVFYCDLEKEKSLFGTALDQDIKDMWHKHQEVGSSLFKGPSKSDLANLLLIERIKPINESCTLQCLQKPKSRKAKSSASSMERILKRLKSFQKKGKT